MPDQDRQLDQLFVVHVSRQHDPGVLANRGGFVQFLNCAEHGPVLLAAEGGLAFIGYSVKPPSASWGLMIAEARNEVDDAWWATVFPALMLFMTVLRGRGNSC